MPPLRVRINHQIRAPEVMLIDADGQRVGVVSLSKALALAEEQGLDLVEVASHLQPPVAKIIDYGRFRYEQEKSSRKRRTQSSELKEVRLSVNIDEHDLATKKRAILKFLGQGNKVKLNLLLRGRQVTHAELAERLLENLVAQLADSAILEQEITRQGRSFQVLLAPKKKGSHG